jgi:hypothetical protein
MPSAIDAHGLRLLQARSHSRPAAGMSAAWPPATSMDGPQMAAFLRDADFCVLATTGTALKPLARPVSFVVVGTSLWCATGSGARVRHLRQSAWASAVVTEGGRGAHRAMSFDGPVDVMTDAPPEILMGYQDKDGSAEWASFWCELRPETVFSFTSGT